MVARRFGSADAYSACVDESYGGSIEDLARVRIATEKPILAKDIIVDPIQIALSAEKGASAVLLIASVLGSRLEDLMDSATLVGVEAAVEVHTPNECRFALNAGATLLVVNNRDRLDGQLHSDQALYVRDLIPPNVVAVAAGGIDSLAAARRLALAGYDGVMVGRKLLTAGDPAFASALRDVQVTPVDHFLPPRFDGDE
ncbi:hypothetical protein CTAYLR_005702 [Chrysophaeum taylorii]|uniref:indole-3-glycerol-phosphate synthase n=1 Tax=Chrysophaeum taylorii TaxID=2483200 RepID=A0AAD7UBN0_9STRA|nr:hypothetical protein CTAYLR_005702 [Chrysophaeum taylorii]